MRKVAYILPALLIGCASPEQYLAYSQGQAAIESAKHAADAARYKAMSDIAASGDSASKVAAVMALAIGQAQTPTQLQPPPKNEALQWAQILVPGLTSIAGIYYGAKVGMNASDNAAAVSMSTNNAFLGMAGKIQAPAVPQANVYTTNTSTVTTNTDRHDITSPTTLSGVGTLGSGDYGTADRHDSTAITNPIKAAP